MNKVPLALVVVLVWITWITPRGWIEYVNLISLFSYVLIVPFQCHIRLSTPSHAQRLVSYFSTHSIRQTSGLDGVGSMSAPAHTSSPASTVIPELVLGKREEVYWEKVPEKVRRQAVEKALKLLSASDQDGVPGESVAAPSVDGDGKRRKRRK